MGMIIDAMPEAVDRFEHKLQRESHRDSGGLILIDSVCRQCRAYKSVSILDSSPVRWERDHTCPGAPKIPPKFSR